MDLVHATSLQRINCEDGRYRLQGDNQAIPLAQAGVVYYSEEMMAFIRDLQAAFGSPLASCGKPPSALKISGTSARTNPPAAPGYR